MREMTRFSKILIIIIIASLLFVIWDIIIVKAVHVKSNAKSFKNAIEEYIKQSDGELPSTENWRSQIIEYLPPDTNKELLNDFSINKTLIGKQLSWNSIPPDFVLFFEAKNDFAVGTINDVEFSWHFQFIKPRNVFIVSKNEKGEIIVKEISKPEYMRWEIK